MKNFNENIIKQCIIALLIGSPSFTLAGDQTIKIGLGYKHFEANTHNNTIHSGKDLSIGYGYSYGEKMLNYFQFQVSNSTGPGKGDQVYEQLGFDYPVGFVRWTASGALLLPVSGCAA